MWRATLGVPVLVVVLGVLLSGAALGKGGGGGHGGGHFAGHGGGHFGGHFGGGHGGGHFGGHFAGHGFGHAHVGGFHHMGGGAFVGRGGHRAVVGHSPSFGHIRTAALSSANVRHGLNSFAHASGSQRARMISNPMARAQLAAGAALAGWQGGANGWWRHGHGGYGWVGPIFWPFAYYDIYDYTIWGDGIGFWDYGYPDIYAGIFAPYGYGALSGYARPGGRRHRGGLPVGQLCADDSRDIADLPIEEIAQAIEPTEAQRAALDDLAGASMKAAQIIRTSCPTTPAGTAPGRLAAMEQRIEGMISGVELVRPPLQNLYGLLNDEQKARFNALADQHNRSTARTGGSVSQGCDAAQPAGFAWPQSEIEARLHPSDIQRAALQKLQDSAARAAETLKTACQPTDLLTPLARLDAVANRLGAMLQAVKSVRAALDDFYGTLSDEQKAQFEAIGPRRTS